jgi:hypothetical protein
LATLRHVRLAASEKHHHSHHTIYATCSLGKLLIIGNWGYYFTWIFPVNMSYLILPFYPSHPLSTRHSGSAFTTTSHTTTLQLERYRMSNRNCHFPSTIYRSQGHFPFFLENSCQSCPTTQNLHTSIQGRRWIQSRTLNTSNHNSNGSDLSKGRNDEVGRDCIDRVHRERKHAKS